VLPVVQNRDAFQLLFYIIFMALCTYLSVSRWEVFCRVFLTSFETGFYMYI